MCSRWCSVELMYCSSIIFIVYIHSNELVELATLGNALGIRSLKSQPKHTRIVTTSAFGSISFKYLNNDILKLWLCHWISALIALQSDGISFERIFLIETFSSLPQLKRWESKFETNCRNLHLLLWLLTHRHVGMCEVFCFHRKRTNSQNMCSENSHRFYPLNTISFSENFKHIYQ